MHVRDNSTVILSHRTFVAMDFGDLKRSRGRLLIRSSPPSLSMPRVSEDNEVTYIHSLFCSEAVGATSTVGRQFMEMTESTHAYLTVVAKNLGDIIAERFEFQDLKRL